MVKEKYDIFGMTCSSCKAHVENAVKKLNGITTVNVNLLSNNMIVIYDETKINSKNIINSITNAGYGASLSNIQTKKNENVAEDLIKSMKKRLIVSFIFWIPLMFVSMYHMIFNLFSISTPNFINSLFHGTENSITYAFTQFLLVIPIIFVNRNYFIIGFKRLFKLSPNMDSLIAIGSAAATFYGIFAIFMIGYGLGHNIIEIVDKYRMDLYFESAGTILTLITLGKYLETKSKGKTNEAITKLMDLSPKFATVIRDGKELEIETANILKDDIVIIKPGSKIPVDGIITDGHSFIDQSSITGESIPVEKNIDDTVISGTLNKNGALKIRATKVGDDTTLAQIIKIVEEASNSKAPISRLADTVSGFFVPVVIIIAILSTIIWLIAGQSFEFALHRNLRSLL